MTQKIEALRKDFMEVSAREFDQDSTICPTCNQTLPQDDIEKLIKGFNIQKNDTLNSINAAGKELRKSLDSTSEALEKIREKLTETKEQTNMLDGIFLEKSEEYEKIEGQIKNINIAELEAYKEIQEKLSKLYAEKDEIKILAEEQDNSDQILRLESEIAEINKELARVDLAKESKERIEELKDRERKLAQMVAETEKIEFLCEQYVIAKAGLLEDKLNSKFKTVKFKLFDIQVNGGINETFVTTVGGVPFEDLNSAMRINAGLDIINTLTDYYSFRAPIFIDNRESINKITDTESQVINLIVSKHKNLRVEVDG
jgi:DNA repair exonuclease SbcCD ATPase subunit